MKQSKKQRVKHNQALRVCNRLNAPTMRQGGMNLRTSHQNPSWANLATLVGISGAGQTRGWLPNHTCNQPLNAVNRL